MTVSPHSLLCCLALAGPVAAAQSFDCKAARTGAEIEICASPGLRELDSSLAAAYRKARESAVPAGAAVLRRSQALWLKKRDGCVHPGARTDRARCLENLYAKRIQVLEEFMTTPVLDAQRIRRLTGQLLGEWRVLSVLVPSEGVQALVKDDPQYLGKVLTIGRDKIHFQEAACSSPKFQIRYELADSWVMTQFESGMPATLWPGEAIQRAPVFKISCASGEFGPSSVDVYMKSETEIGLPWYDNALLVLKRI